MNFEQFESDFRKHFGLPDHLLCDNGTDLKSAEANKALNDEGRNLNLQVCRPLHKPTVERLFRSMNEKLSCLPCGQNVTSRK